MRDDRQTRRVARTGSRYYRWIERSRRMLLTHFTLEDVCCSVKDVSELFVAPQYARQFDRLS